MNALVAPAAVPRSTFVTGLGVLCLVLSALGLLSSILQTVAMSTLAGALAQEEPLAAAPIAMFRGVSVLSIALCGFFTYAAIALLQRRNWARITHIILFSLSITGNALGLLIMGVTSSAMGDALGEAGTVLKAGFVFMAIVSLGVMTLLGWFIKRLISAPVKAEFGLAS